MFVRCTAMHVRPLADGLYVVGLEFLEVATDVKEEQMMGKPADASAMRGRQPSLT